VVTLSVILAAAPSVILLVFFYLKDRYEPEPRRYVAAAFVIGIASVVPAYFAARGLEAWVGPVWLALGGVPAQLFEAGVMAAAVEETTKWTLFVGILYRWKELDEPLDGVIYGVALALGFATVENILMVLKTSLGVGLLRAVFAVPAHALFGAVMGFYIGRAKHGRGRHQVAPPTSGARAAALALAWLLPLVFHTLYDFSLLWLRGAWLFVAIIALSIVLWAFVLRRVTRAQEDSPFR
jgi:RsiW-degrading membrane proteinase PrsW (M82 family)